MGWLLAYSGTHPAEGALKSRLASWWVAKSVGTYDAVVLMHRLGGTPYATTATVSGLGRSDHLQSIVTTQNP